jgi:solute carrier family 25 carnitine/acylcarnitine transporter 20/29
LNRGIFVGIRVHICVWIGLSVGTYNGIYDCAVKSYRAEGIPVFFRGLSASLIRAFPLHGMVFLGYEITMKLLK